MHTLIIEEYSTGKQHRYGIVTFLNGYRTGINKVRWVDALGLEQETVSDLERIVCRSISTDDRIKTGDWVRHAVMDTADNTEHFKYGTVTAGVSRHGGVAELCLENEPHKQHYPTRVLEKLAVYEGDAAKHILQLELDKDQLQRQISRLAV